jgi:hypothetical protein
MKTTIKILSGILITIAVSFSTAFAQSPDKINYQAVIRNFNNLLVSNETLAMRISIIHGSVSDSIVYIEDQAPTTNINGLVSIEIGSGTVMFGNFYTINWGNGPYFIKTETTLGGANSTVSSTSQLMSVPYALHAKTAQSLVGGITETDPVFGASIASQITAADTANWNNHFVDTDTQLDAVSVDSIVNYLGYLTTEIDGSVTNEIELPTGGTNGQVLKTDGAGNYSWVNQSINTDNQNIAGSILTGTNLTIGIEGGTSQDVDLSTLQDGDAWGVTGEDITSAVGRNGNVGIGTSTPSHKIHIEGNAKVTQMPLALLTDSLVFASNDGEIRKMSVARYTNHVIERIFPPSVGSLSGVPGACTGITVSGTYTVGNLLEASNLIMVEVNVTTDHSFTTAGTYTISTDTINGYYFYKEGIFLNAGVQTIGIQATGTPVTAGTDSFTITYNGGSCLVDVTIAP